MVFPEVAKRGPYGPEQRNASAEASGLGNMRKKNGASVSQPLGKSWERMPERHPPYGSGRRMLQVRNSPALLRFLQRQDLSA